MSVASIECGKMQTVSGVEPNLSVRHGVPDTRIEWRKKCLLFRNGADAEPTFETTFASGSRNG